MFQRPDDTYAVDPAAVERILADPQNPLHRAAELIPNGSKVLDVGAGNGLLAQVLSRVRSDLTLDGVEPSAAAADLAEPHYRRFHVGYAEEIADEIRAEEYDFIVLADVIEHVADPLAFVESVKALGAANTAILLSVPNVAFGAVRLSLMRGEFRYTDSGLLERTHLRFFTLETLHQLFEAADLGVEREIHHQKDMVTSEIRLRLRPFDVLTALWLQRDPLASTYQFFFVLRPGRGPRPAPEFHGPRSSLPTLLGYYRANRGR